MKTFIVTEALTYRVQAESADEAYGLIRQHVGLDLPGKAYGIEYMGDEHISTEEER